MIRVVIAEDHTLIREALVKMLVASHRIRPGSVHGVIHPLGFCSQSHSVMVSLGRRALSIDVHESCATSSTVMACDWGASTAAAAPAARAERIRTRALLPALALTLSVVRSIVDPRSLLCGDRSSTFTLAAGAEEPCGPSWRSR